MEERYVINNKEKTNKKFMMLSIFGIIFVVMGHCGGINAFFNNVFPYYSFHMALFVFISGYFFKDRKILDFLKNKTKKMILVYLIWNLIYGIIAFTLKKCNLISNTYTREFTLYNIFMAPFYGNSNQFIFNLSGWFVIALYFIQVIYFICNKILKRLSHNNTEIIMFIISVIIAIIELNYIRNIGQKQNIYYILTRISFLMPFYCIGQLYKKIEKYDKLNNIIYFSLIIIIQVVMLQKFKNLTYNLNILLFNHNYVIYLIGSMTGILFWLRISKIIALMFENNKIINYIGNNTFTIMMHHLFVFYLLNTIIYIIHKISGEFEMFDVNKYKTSIWYVYDKTNPAIIMIYVILGIAIPLIFKYYVFDKIYRKINNKLQNMNIKIKKNANIES